ncbi:MAG: serine--tRNA ligase, partial [Clostridia bacterium]|nr:serine--tRNA ligase [Clostridia bacterium]
MLDIRYIKEKPDEVIARLAKKGKDAKEEIAQILDLDAKRRALIGETEALKAEQNKLS